ncbi:MAG TPA: OmpA family protein [Bryobacteraceae bacterium]|nr:OmpA family protein [Bryobacteraceae bacterium]
MKRLAVVAGLVVVVAALATVDYKGIQSIKNLEAQVTSLRQDVNSATQLAQEESAAAAAASQRADVAAARAEAAAAGRQQAEAQKQQAEQDRAQALSSEQQAAQQAKAAQDQAKQAQDQLVQIRHERQQELDRMQEALSKIVDTRRTPNGMLITLPDSTFRFNFDSAELNQKNRELLSRVAGILLVSKGYGLSVFGYTDDVGSDDYNQQLSMRRAKAVEDYLVKAGIDPAIINVKGYGKTSPLVPGTTTLARAKNRRVEIALTDSEIKYVGETPSGDR